MEAIEPQSNFDAATSEKDETVKSQQDERERKANLVGNEEKNMEENGDELARAAELKGKEPEKSEMSMNEEKKADIVFQQEPVVPLRSRGNVVSFLFCISQTDFIHRHSRRK